MRSREFLGPTSSFTDILLASGYDNSQDLSGLIEAWRSIIRLYGADVVVCDHAPTALLAAHSLGLRAIAIGTGFELPPAQVPYPPFNHKSGSYEQLRNHQIALRNINAALLSFHAPPLTELSEISGSADRFFTTLEELDHYGLRAGADYIGPLSSGDSGKKAKWLTTRQTKGIIYLRGPERLLANVISALSETDAETICIFPGIQFNWNSLPSHIQVASDFIDFSRLLGDCSFVVSNGGAGISSQSLLNGVPSVTFPLYDEQSMMSERLSAGHYGLPLPLSASAEDIKRSLAELIRNPIYRQEAYLVREKYRYREPGYAEQRIVRHIFGLNESATNMHDAHS
jgi:UDP:flavonoid glycosyltransferase YjiC (YdhE family)